MNYPFGASLPVIALYLMMELCPISPYLGPSKTQVTPNTEPVWGQQQLIRRVMGSTWARYQTDFETVLGRLPGTNQENTGHLLPAKSEDTTALAMATLVARNGNPRFLLNKKKKKKRLEECKESLGPRRGTQQERPERSCGLQFRAHLTHSSWLCPLEEFTYSLALKIFYANISWSHLWPRSHVTDCLRIYGTSYRYSQWIRTKVTCWSPPNLSPWQLYPCTICRLGASSILGSSLYP